MRLPDEFRVIFVLVSLWCFGVAQAQLPDIAPQPVLVEGVARIHSKDMASFFPGDHEVRVRAWYFGSEIVTELNMPEGRLVYVVGRDDSVVPWRGDANSLMARFCGSRGSAEELALTPLGYTALVSRRFRLGGQHLGDVEVTQDGGVTTHLSVLSMDGAYAGSHSLAKLEVSGEFVRGYSLAIDGPPGNFPRYEFECDAPFPGHPTIPTNVTYTADFAGASDPTGVKETKTVVHRIESVRELNGNESFASVVAEATKGLRQAPEGDSDEIQRASASETARAQKSAPTTGGLFARIRFLMGGGIALVALGLLMTILRSRTAKPRAR